MVFKSFRSLFPPKMGNKTTSKSKTKKMPASKGNKTGEKSSNPTKIPLESHGKGSSRPKSENTVQSKDEKPEKEASKLVEKFLNCAACGKVLQIPVVLNCGHLMCAQCLVGYKEPAASEIKCPSCTGKHVVSGCAPLQVVALSQMLSKLNLKRSESKPLKVCAKHLQEGDLKVAKEVCGNVNWTVNYERKQFANLVSQIDSDRMPYGNELRVVSDVYQWKNGVPIESEVCFSEGLRWAFTVVPSRDDGELSYSKALTFDLGISCKGWADRSCTKPMSKAKLNVWFTVVNLSDCEKSYNSGPRSCKFDHLGDPRKRFMSVVSHVMPMSKVRGLNGGWIEDGIISIICKFKVPKKMIKLNLSQMKVNGPFVTQQQPEKDKDCDGSVKQTPKMGEKSEHRKESTSS